MTPIDFFHRAAERFAHTVAATEPATPNRAARALSYHELARQSAAMAAALQALTGKARPTVALLCANSLDMLVATLAVYACRGVLVPLTPKNPAAEIAQQIEAARPDLIMADASAAERVLNAGVPVIALGEAPSCHAFDVLLRQHDGQSPTATAVDAGQLAAIKFTGGSSGRPKAVTQSARCLNTMIVSLQLVYGFEAGEKFLVAPPMTHGAGTFLLPVLASGGCLVIMNAPRADALLDALADEQVAATWVPPTLLYQLIDSQAQRPRALPRLRNLLYGGAGATQQRLLQGRALFGDVIGVTYGLTEAPVILAGMAGPDSADPQNLGCAGRVAPLTRLAAMAPDGSLLPPGAEGEIVACGDLLMSGYLGMPEETAKTIVNGWLHTGDVGYLDERGYLFIKGRIKDVIISGGFNVYPSDVEAALALHPAVAESVAFGLPDAHWGERVEASVELKAGMRATAAELQAHVKDSLGPVRTPKAIHLIASLPRNSLGKIQKRELRKQLIEAQA